MPPKSDRLPGLILPNFILNNGHRCQGLDPVKQPHKIDTAHTYTTVRPRMTKRLTRRRAVNVYVAPHGIDTAQTVKPGFRAAQPKNSGQYPVPVSVLIVQPARPHLPGGAPSDKHGTFWLTMTNLGTNNVTTERCLKTTCLLARTA